MKPDVRIKQMKVFAAVLPLMMVFLAWRHYHKTGVDALVICLLTLAAALVISFIFFRSFFEQFFGLWMKVAHKIGEVLSAVVLASLYFIIFALVAMVLRLMRKDFMNRQWSKQEASYWNSCKPTVSKDRYLNQF